MNAEHIQQLELALRQLLDCDYDGGLVVIEEQYSRKFVQIASSPKTGMVLDVPLKPLSSEERQRADQHFSSFSVSHTEYGFQLPLGRDIPQAVEVTKRIFNEVYQVDAHAQFTVTAACEAHGEEAECDRCGRIGTGRYQWMYHIPWISMLLTGAPIEREFFCFRCLRIMRIYAVIGFSLLGLVVAALVASTIWLVYFMP